MMTVVVETNHLQRQNPFAAMGPLRRKLNKMEHFVVDIKVTTLKLMFAVMILNYGLPPRKETIGVVE
ncbi:hypothetical protein DPMN_130104 [Dreissena polymorpha]|uniref:Uncharacterized protein n=1 Tax=Dreissena polymorpha TaxID=45954 RepID=A0A9D4HAD2_DREPO|nr:hypothetical protein DPMN_130104 [Dreissena polymorpha]